MILSRLETEVSKWDDSSNDIVLLAKEICWMVMDMSDFTRQDKQCIFGCAMSAHHRYTFDTLFTAGAWVLSRPPWMSSTLLRYVMRLSVLN